MHCPVSCSLYFRDYRPSFIQIQSEIPILSTDLAEFLTSLAEKDEKGCFRKYLCLMTVADLFIYVIIGVVPAVT